ncbi:PREDICTED: alpha-glucan water dikinase 2 isoform X2 [Nelumbo nucifera]|uniref:Alpha-glucan water dikinase 2 isoform X2 n=1 Tax=Nelumbo nucifera TaxID=4432 RepID=A0A1U7ZKP0_NELNU|nr:PREDICTED: alpha-glucan water dikinase 2 isoform X2 [Nelumbo nucifera]
MASSKSTNGSQTPLVYHFELGEGMQLQVNVSGSSSGCNAKIELQLKNCSRTWILHWGGLYRGHMNWAIPADRPSGTRIYKQTALQTPLVKKGEIYSIIIELRDPKIHAIEFVLKDERHDRWLKLNKGNFRIEIPEVALSASPLSSIPRELVERKAYLLWESKGKPRNSLQQQEQDYEDALRELQSQSSKGLSLDELRRSLEGASTKRITQGKELAVFNSSTSSTHPRGHDIDKWLQKSYEGHTKGTSLLASPLFNLVEKSIGGDNWIMQQTFHVGNHDILVLLRILRGDYHILVAVNMKGAIVLHWGVSKSSYGEWLAPPPDILPERSKLLDGACQTYFKDVITREGSFQLVDINLKQKDFLGISFVLWSGGSWIKNNGANFFVGLKPMNKGEGDSKGIVKWLLDEISQREKDAQRSLMHRFNIAAELTERCKNEGQLGLIGIFVWLRFMTSRQLTWNKNYNVKPREISAAQDKFTDLLQKIYLSQPNDREIVRLIMTCIGRGGQGDVGQRIRDEILVLQRNNDCKSGMMEEWHQKLHNNSSPDDVIICQALLDYVRSDYKIDVYWRTLKANGITKDILGSYDRPIVSEPCFRADAKEGLIRDLTSYLRTLKAVHSGVDLESAIETCLGYSSKGHDFMSGIQVHSVSGLSLRLQECLNFVKTHIDDKNIGPLMEKLLEARIELFPVLVMPHERLKDLLFLDLALASAVRTTMERGFKDLQNAHLPDMLFLISLVLENLCLSTVNNEDLIYCTKDWCHIRKLYDPNGEQWALQTKAVLDRLQLVLTDKSQHYQRMIQPSAQYLGQLLGVQKWAIDIFTEEVIRAGSAPILSMLINRLHPILRKIANLGCWQVISPLDVCGFVTSVNELMTVQDKVYKQPTVLIANKVTGGEEIPDGVVAVLTHDMPDVLSHVSIRARNSKVCFATCFDQRILQDLKLKEGKAVSIWIKFSNLEIRDISSSAVSFGPTTSTFPQALTLKKKNFGGKYAISIEEFTSDTVGAKSRNIQFLRGRVPSWIKIPMSIALPFGVFEHILFEDLNRDVANKISSLSRLVQGGDLSKLQVIREVILQLKAPPPLVWASKWNERAYISCRKASLNHDHLCMAVLVQEIISADYAFVIHTRNPLSGDTSEIYTEVVKGLGETLVGAYPGRAMSFITKKSNLKSPKVVGFPSKQIGLFIKKSLIFRSDSNGEDLEGYAGAGLYDSIPMDEEQEVLLDYSCDRLMVDKSFQLSLFSKIAEVGNIIEGLYRSAQDIEGVVKDGEIYVVQTRPQI